MTEPVYIAGVGMTPFDRHQTVTSRELFGQAAREAFADADLPPDVVEEVFVGNFMGEVGENQGHMGPMLAKAAANELREKVQQLRKEGKPVIPIQRGTDKLTRAYDASPYIESGHVILLRDVPHLSDMLAEASAFPNGAHDDTLDPMMDAVGDVMTTQAQPRIRSL